MAEWIYAIHPPEAPDEATARRVIEEDPVGYARGELRPFRISLVRGRD
jgi:hypothetical protein